MKTMTKEKTFYVLKDVDGHFASIRERGVAFRLQGIRVYAYINRDIHRIYYVDPETGVSFSKHFLEFIKDFNSESEYRILEEAPQAMNQRDFDRYVRFLMQPTDEEQEIYTTLKNTFRNLPKFDTEKSAETWIKRKEAVA